VIRSLVVAALAGAVVMALEILASRWLAPAFGFTLTTWSLLIAITLLAGSIGAAFGGLWSHGARWGRVNALLIVAGLWIGICAFFAPYIVDRFLEQPVLEGALYAALTILPVPVLCLSAVVPLLGQLREGKTEPGRLLGMLIAASTVGSLVGTLATALWLIPTFGLRVSALTPAVLLLVSAGVMLQGRRTTVTGILVGVLLFVAQLFAPHPGNAVELERNTPYGRLTIERTASGRGIFIDGIAQARDSSLASGPGALIVGRQYVELLPFMRPLGRTALNVGLGSGMVPHALGAYDIDVESIDVNPVLVEVVRDQFDFDGVVHVGDGRAVWRRMNKRFDFIVLDAFQGEVLPGHLVTEEAFRELRDRLTDRGVICLHVIGRPRHAVTGALAKTMTAVFANVRCAKSGIGDELQDLFLFASDGALEVRPAEELERAGWLGNEWFEPRLDVAVLTDDHNPIDVLNESLGREIRMRSRRGS